MGCSARIAPGDDVYNFGTSEETHQLQVLRNQSVGSRATDAASGPRLTMVMRIRISSTSFLAYSAKTSK